MKPLEQQININSFNMRPSPPPQKKTKQNKTKQNLLQVNDDSDNGGLKLETTLTVFTVRSKTSQKTLWNSKVVKLTLTRAHLVWYTILRTSATGLGTVTTGECVDGLCGGPEAMSWPDDEWGEGGEELSPSMMLKAALPGKTKHKIVWNLTT